MSNDPQKDTSSVHIITFGDLNAANGTRFDITLTADERRMTAEFLNIRQVKKLRFQGEIYASGVGDWSLLAHLGASVVQDCVITGAPVATRIDTEIKRLYRKDWSESPSKNEAAFDGDTESEPLGSNIDLDHTMQESLALALPDYPKAEGAELLESVFAAPETTPLRDQDMKPFASLADLKDKLSK